MRRGLKQTLISHCGVWLISNSWFASSNEHKCGVNIVKQEEVNADMFTAYQTVVEGLGCVPGKYKNELICYTGRKVLGKVVVTLQSPAKRQLSCVGQQQIRQKVQEYVN